MPVDRRITQLQYDPRITNSSKEHAARSAAMKERFHHSFTRDQQHMLLTAAGQSNLLFLALASGRWEAVVRALGGYVILRVPQDEWDGYRQLIEVLNRMTPNIREDAAA